MIRDTVICHLSVISSLVSHHYTLRIAYKLDLHRENGILHTTFVLKMDKKTNNRTLRQFLSHCET